MFIRIKKKPTTLTFTIFLFLFLCLSNVRLWENFIFLELNKILSNSKYKIVSANLSGNIFNNIKISNLNIQNESLNKILIDRIILNIDFFSSIFNKLTFDDIIIENINPKSLALINNSSINDIKYKIPNLRFNIDNFFINGRLPLNIQDSLYFFNIGLSGLLQSNDSLNIELTKLDLKNDSYNPSKLVINNTKIIANDNGIKIDQISGFLNDAPIKGFLSYNSEESKYKGILKINDFYISKDFFSKTPLKGKFSNLSGQLNFESASGNITGNLSVSNDLGLNMNGDLELLDNNSDIILKSLNLYGEDSKLRVNGVWENNGRLSGYFILDSLDLSRWVIDQKPTLLSGMAILESSLDENKALENIELTLEVAEYGVFSNLESSFHGTINYRDSIIITVDPVMLIIGESILSLDGKVNLNSRDIDITSYLENADINIINQFLVDQFTSGVATGELKVRGSIDAPDVVADLNCKNIIYRDFTLDNLSLHSEMKPDSSFPSGFVNLKMDNGKWKNEKFDNGTLDISFSKERMVVENFHFKFEDDYFILSGSWFSKNKYKIDKIQAAYRGNYLINSKPIFIAYQDTSILIEPFEIHINDGILDGKLSIGNYSSGIFNMSNFDANVITQFMNNKYLNLSGIVFGELIFNSLDTLSSYDVDISLKKGNYMGEPFDQMNIAFLYQSGILHIDDISMTKDTSMGLQLSGVLPLIESNKINENVSLFSTFKNLSLPMIHKLIPKFYTIKGRGTGSVNMSGTLKSTNFNYMVNIEDAVFDLVELGSLSSKGEYNGDYLDIKFANASNGDDLIKSYGIVPFDLNLSSKRFGKLFSEDTLDFHSSGNLSSMPFLSPYISELDSIRGNIDIMLSLSGPANSIIRNGAIDVKNSSIYTMLINNPITNVNGRAEMLDNVLDITYLNGGSFNPNSNKNNFKENNLTISGLIDFKSFFKPNYNISVESINQNEIYIETLPIDLIGFADSINVSIYGKDTVNIEGDIEIVDITLFHEFIFADVGTSLSNKDGLTMSYSLNVPIKGEGKFQNSQVDAIMIGQISLSKIGDQFWSIGGEVFIEDGSIFSFKDNFKNLNGYVTFDNNGINPNMNLRAITNIDNEEIRLGIIGDLDNTELILESASGFSESDILELLTWGKRFEETEISSTGFGIQANSVLGTLLETEIEKNLQELSIMQKLAPDNIDITGAAGFISSGMYSNERDQIDDFKISAKKKFGNRTIANLSYKKSFSLTNPDQLQIGVEYKLNRNLSLVGNMDDQGNLHFKYRYRYAY